MKKNTLFLLLIIAVQSITFAQRGRTPCPDPVEANYNRVMSETFAREYADCPVIIVAEFFANGFPRNFTSPRKFRNKHLFQCVNIGESGSAMPITGEMAGDFFVIDREQAETVLNLKRGDKIRLTGVTDIHRPIGGYGAITNVFFIVQKVEVLTD